MSVRRLALSLALVLVGVSATTGGALAASQAPTAARPCLLVAKGPAWSSKGQKGTAYNILGVNGGSCATALKWFARFTHGQTAIVKGPSGWSCLAVSAVTHQGECTLKNGGIVEWGPKLKK
jgi:hypothetical protein